MSYENERENGASYLGRVITVFIERYPGKNHSPNAYTGFFRKGNARLRVYAVGIKEPPGSRFTGRVIGLVYEDSEGLPTSRRPEAMILAPISVKLNQAELAELCFSDEDAKHYRIEPLYHKSCGAIVFRQSAEHGLEFLVLNEQHSEKWGFPKGHMERGENEYETASREIFEEAGFHPEFRDEFREEIHYRISASGEKSVTYFLSEYDGPIHIRENEIASYAWITPDHARQYLHRSNLIRAIEKAQDAILSDTKKPAL